MICDYNYTLSKWQCHSADKTPTLRFKIFTSYEEYDVVECCAACSEKLKDELAKGSDIYIITSIQKEGDDSAVSTARP